MTHPRGDFLLPIPRQGETAATQAHSVRRRPKECQRMSKFGGEAALWGESVPWQIILSYGRMLLCSRQPVQHDKNHSHTNLRTALVINDGTIITSTTPNTPPQKVSLNSWLLHTLSRVPCSCRHKLPTLGVASLEYKIHSFDYSKPSESKVCRHLEVHPQAKPFWH